MALPPDTVNTGKPSPPRPKTPLAKTTRGQQDPVEWETTTVLLEQQGFFFWKWEVRDSQGRYLSDGDAATKRGAIRKARRWKRGFLLL